MISPSTLTLARLTLWTSARIGREYAILKPMLKQRDPVELVFHALGDPTRRQIVETLSHAPASVSELARPLAISLPAVVQHLHVLEESGLVGSQKVGRVRTCHVRQATMSQAERWIAQRREEWERRLDRLGEYLLGADDTPTTSERSTE
jgi:DNA-binding transcriptional ArsR family regulator